MIIYEHDRVLIDRYALAVLTGRSERTIRAACAVAFARYDLTTGKALYELDAAEAALTSTPRRRRRVSPGGSAG